VPQPFRTVYPSRGSQKLGRAALFRWMIGDF